MASYTITTKSSCPQLTPIVKTRARRDVAKLWFERAVQDALSRRAQLDTRAGRTAYELSLKVHSTGTDKVRVTIKDLTVEFLKVA